MIERKARELGLIPQQRHELRLDESLPILNALGTCIILPKIRATG
jgi:hypothetical protein